MLYFTYIDRTADTDVAFYVGKGNANRIRGKIRNKHHTNIVQKHGMKRDIVFSTDVEDLAFKREVELIAELHTFVDDPEYNGFGCNYTPGGEGHSPSAYDRHMRSQRAKDRWSDPDKRASYIQKMTGVLHASGPRPLQSEAIRGSNNPNYQKRLSVSTREKIGLKNSGRIPWNKGKKTHSHSTKQVTVITLDTRSHEFQSFKEATQFVSSITGNSVNTINCYFVARRTSYKGLVFVYDNTND